MILYHGSPIIIKDVAMASCTFFSDDIDIARQYGKYIYSIEVDDKLLPMFCKDILNEHYITTGQIPFYMFDIID